MVAETVPTATCYPIYLSYQLMYKLPTKLFNGSLIEEGLRKRRQMVLRVMTQALVI